MSDENLNLIYFRPFFGISRFYVLFIERTFLGIPWGLSLIRITVQLTSLLIISFLFGVLCRDCRVVRDPQTLKSKGYGFVSFVKKTVSIHILVVFFKFFFRENGSDEI